MQSEGCPRTHKLQTLVLSLPIVFCLYTIVEIKISPLLNKQDKIFMKPLQAMTLEDDDKGTILSQGCQGN